MTVAAVTPAIPTGVSDIHLRLAAGVRQALDVHCQRTGESLNHAVSAAVAAMLDIEHHTLWQVSTSGAMVEGIFQGCTTIGDIRKHGDFGVGTFDGLDGEGMLLDGVFYQGRADGTARVVPDDTLAPFFTTTFFDADEVHQLDAVADLDDLAAQFHSLRPSENLFVALRIEGTFTRLKWRAPCKVAPGTDLETATSHQSVFEEEGITGTVFGFWSPAYASAITVPGLHLHFMSADLKQGGHVLQMEAAALRMELHQESELFLALPDTPGFLDADLTGDVDAKLHQAEIDHP